MNKDLFHEKIPSLRNTAKLWSIETYKLRPIIHLQKEGLEILNAQLARQTVVVWIWCRSQVALENLKRLHESNQLIDILFSLTSIQPPDSEVSKSSVVNIDCNQLKNKVGRFS